MLREGEQLTGEDFLNGQVILIDKEADWTSFDVVNKIRYTLKGKFGLKKIKVGHAGTLDPLATGLMIICTGRATKSLQQMMEHDKEYISWIRLGGTTPSYDMEEKPDKEYPYEHITKQMTEQALDEFTGEREQIPPIFSAKRVNGVKAYKLARKGENPIMKPKLIRYYELELLDYNLPDVKVRVRCSKGTYIRSFARDLGQKLDSGAYLTCLLRTVSGEYHVEDARKITDVVRQIEQM